MILGYATCLFLGIMAFLLAAKLGLSMRVGIALAVFLIPAVILTAWTLRVGDKPLGDAITIVPTPNPITEKGDTDRRTAAPK
jgi:hypothetical protein